MNVHHLILSSTELIFKKYRYFVKNKKYKIFKRKYKSLIHKQIFLKILIFLFGICFFFKFFFLTEKSFEYSISLRNNPSLKYNSWVFKKKKKRKQTIKKRKKWSVLSLHSASSSLLFCRRPLTKKSFGINFLWLFLALCRKRYWGHF